MSARDDADFTAYVQAKLPWLRRVGYLLCQDWDRADDLVQSAITSMYARWGRIRRLEHLDGYARVTLVRAFLSERRSGWARRVKLAGWLPESADQPWSPGASGDRAGALDVRRALAALPPRQRATLVLRYYLIAVATAIVAPAARHAPGGGPAAASPASGSRPPAVAPRRFSPLRPYVSFGWLPAGYSLGSAPYDTLVAGPTSTSLTVATASTVRSTTISLTMVTDGSRRFTGATVRGYLAHPSGRSPVLSCRSALGWPGTSAVGATWRGRVVSPAPRVAGRPALWIGEWITWAGHPAVPLYDGGALAWEYAPGGWAVLTGYLPPAHAAAAHRAERTLLRQKGSRDKPRAVGKGNVRQVIGVTLSGEQETELLRIARSLRYRATAPILFPFHLAHRPAGWQIAGTSFAVSGGRMLDRSLQLTAPDGVNTLQLSAAPARGPCAVKFIPGQSSRETVGGSPAMFRYIDQPGKHVQTLCASDLHGMAVYIERDLSVPATARTPLTGQAGLTRLLRRIHLLGPDPARWTTSPVS